MRILEGYEPSAKNRYEECSKVVENLKKNKKRAFHQCTQRNIMNFIEQVNQSAHFEIVLQSIKK